MKMTNAVNGLKFETSNSYKMLAQIENFQFVWITDGEGWNSARRNLKETFLELDTLYNIQDLEHGIFVELFTKNLKGS